MRTREGNLNMVWTIIWFVMWVVYTAIWIGEIVSGKSNTADFLTRFAGMIGIMSMFVSSLYLNNLTFYFYWTRFRNWFRNYPSRWRLNVRYDGKFGQDCISSISRFVSDLKRDGTNAKIQHQTTNSMNFIIHDTLNFYLTYAVAGNFDIENDQIDLALSPFEIGCNDSKRKLDTKIIPILNRLYEILKPRICSYVLDISFLKGNPFFTLFVSHLKVTQIGTFTINLLLDEYSESKAKDVVTIQKENVIVSANNLHSLKQLAEDFIYLSANAKRYLKPSGHA